MNSPALGEMAARSLITPDELRQRISNSDSLTMLPAVATEAIEIANDPSFSMANFVSVIERDPQLVTDILSLCNSAAYRTRCEIHGIQHAVATIGSSQCKNLIISSSLKSLMKSLPPSVEWSRNVLWSHCLQTAMIARCLNKELRLGFEGEEFSAAMVHDLGRLLVAAAAPEVFEVVDRLTFHEPAGFLECEQAMINTDHCEIGAWFADLNHLPDSLIDVIRHHHNPADAPASKIKLVQLVSAADQMANHLMHAGCVEGFAFETIQAFDSLLADSSEPHDVVAARVMKAAQTAIDEDESSLSIN